jgi:hypothetical protein
VILGLSNNQIKIKTGGGSGPRAVGCTCCNNNQLVIVRSVTVAQACAPSACGELPCTSSDAVYDEDGNCVFPAYECSPNWEELTRAEKCLAQKYMTVETFDKFDELPWRAGRISEKNYTISANEECSSETKCSGQKIIVISTQGSHTISQPCLSPEDDEFGTGYAGTNFSSSLNAEETTTVTFLEDCTTSEELNCSGSSSSTNTIGGGCGFPQYTESCTSTFKKNAPGTACIWEGTRTDFDGITTPTTDHCHGLQEITSETTISPSECKVEVTYSNPNFETNCTPPTLPGFPEFPACESIVFPTDEAYNFSSPWNFTSEQRVRIRIEHAPSSTCYLKIWLRKKIQNWKFEDCDTGFSGDLPRTAPITVDCDETPCSSRWSTNGEPSYASLGVYVWSETDTPCLQDPSKPAQDCANRIYGSVFDITAGDDQSISVEYKFSQDPNYEPPWP